MYNKYTCKHPKIQLTALWKPNMFGTRTGYDTDSFLSIFSITSLLSANYFKEKVVKSRNESKPKVISHQI